MPIDLNNYRKTLIDFSNSYHEMIDVIAQNRQLIEYIKIFTKVAHDK